MGDFTAERRYEPSTKAVDSYQTNRISVVKILIRYELMSSKYWSPAV